MRNKDEFLTAFKGCLETKDMVSVNQLFDIFGCYMPEEVTLQEVKDYEEDVIRIVNEKNMNFIKSFVSDGKLLVSIDCVKHLGYDQIIHYVEALREAGKLVLTEQDYYHGEYCEYKENGKQVYAVSFQMNTVTLHWNFFISAGEDGYKETPGYWRAKINFLYKLIAQINYGSSSICLVRKVEQETGWVDYEQRSVRGTIPYVNHKTYGMKLSVYEQLEDLFHAAFPEKLITLSFLRECTLLLKQSFHYYGVKETIALATTLFKKRRTGQSIHDVLYGFGELGNGNCSILTLGSMKQIVSVISDPLMLSGVLVGVSTGVSRMKALLFKEGKRQKKMDQEMKLLRKKITHDFRVSGKAMVDSILDSTYFDNLLSEYQVGDLGIEKEVIKDFLARINRYAGNVTVARLVDRFGEVLLKRFMLGTKKGFFQEHTFESTNELGSVVEEVLTNHPSKRKLFGKLRAIQDPKEMIASGVNAENVEAVVEVLKNFQIASPMMEDALIERNISAKIERKGSPEFLVAGDASVCCMSLFTEKATQYARYEEFGIFNLYYKDRIVGNSLIWMDDNGGLILDNIEIHPNYEKYNRFFAKKYEELYQFCKKEYDAKFLLQGKTYNDLKLYTRGNCVVIQTQFPKSLRDVCKMANRSIYSDADDGCFVIHADEENPYPVIHGNKSGYVDGIYFERKENGYMERDIIIQGTNDELPEGMFPEEEGPMIHMPEFQEVPTEEEVQAFEEWNENPFMEGEEPTESFPNGIPDEEGAANILDILEPWRVRANGR